MVSDLVCPWCWLGKHRIEVVAPGYKTWSKSLTIEEGDNNKPLDVTLGRGRSSAPRPSKRPSKPTQDEPKQDEPKQDAPKEPPKEDKDNLFLPTKKKDGGGVFLPTK